VSNGERFALLFKGHPLRYGRYDITGDVAPEEKVAGKARTVDQEISVKDYTDHVEGRVGIGVIPLQGQAKEEGRVNFAAIDIDVYTQEEKEARNLTHEDVALALFETPLIVTRSKSGGIHVWLFSEQGVSARLATEYLNAHAAQLGVSGCEVFPKQTERYSNEDIGNWINLPYFGDSRKAVLPIKEGSTYSYVDVGLDDFLDVAEGASKDITDDWLIENTVAQPASREFKEGVDLFYDGPPCLQRLIIGDPKKVERLEQRHNKKVKDKSYRSEAEEKRAGDWLEKQKAALAPQNLDNNRNNTFFNVALYLHRRLSPHDPDAPLDDAQAKVLAEQIDDIHGDWRVATGNKGISKELPTIKKQGKTGKWGYSCTKEPLKSYCDRRTCLKRQFGIGTTKNDEEAISGFTIVEADERQYYMNVGDKRIHVPDAQSLQSQSIFAQHVLNQTDRMWRMMQDTKYREMMDVLLQKADRIAPPPDSDRTSVMLNALHDFVMDKKIAKGKNDSAMFTGRVIWSEDELTAMFKLDQFHAFIRGRGLMWTTQAVAKILTDDLNVIGRGNTEVAGRQVRPYEVNITNLKQLMAEDGHGED